MASYGTTQKCNACDKVVHHVEMMSVDGVPYHKNCFRCSQCNGHLSMSNYSSVEGKLYCKIHSEQLFRESGGATSNKPSGKSGELGKSPSKVSAFFSGTQDKCAVCTKTVYPLEKVSVEEKFYHKQCFRCAHGGCNITPSSYAALDGIIYCKPHFAQLFKEKGSYAHLTQTANSKKNALAQDAASPAPDESEEVGGEDPTTEPPAEEEEVEN